MSICATRFFDVERFPDYTFVSRIIEPRGYHRGSLSRDRRSHGACGHATGDARCRGLPARRGIAASSPPYHRHDLLNRRDFGLAWGNPMIKVADEARVTVELDVVPL
jgi:hypothetical protein